MRGFYYTNFIAIATHREHSKLDIKWQELSDFYEKILFGPTILKRHRRPSLQSIIHAERHAWQHIITEMWDGISLSVSLLRLKNDTLWWTNELDYEMRTSQWPHQPSYQAGTGRRTATTHRNQLLYHNTPDRVSIDVSTPHLTTPTIDTD